MRDETVEQNFPAYVAKRAVAESCRTERNRKASCSPGVRPTKLFVARGDSLFHNLGMAEVLIADGEHGVQKVVGEVFAVESFVGVATAIAGIAAA